MAEQVGPANGKPITMVAFEADVIDWLPLARIPSWPGAERSNLKRPKIRLQSDSCSDATVVARATSAEFLHPVIGGRHELTSLVS